VLEDDPSTHFYAQPEVTQALTHFMGGLGGREALLTELLISPEIPPALLMLLQFSFDPRFSDKPFGWLCAKARISPGEVFLAFRDVLAAKATIQAMHQTTKELVVLLKELVQSAITHEETCEECQGLTQVWRKPDKKASYVKVPCPTCNAKGTVVVKPDREAQKMVLDLVGLTKRQAGTMVNVGVGVNTSAQVVQQSFGDSPASISAGLPQVQQALSSILFSRDVVRPQPPIDVSASPTAASDLPDPPADPDTSPAA
jgi:hypothetical protein